MRKEQVLPKSDAPTVVRLPGLFFAHRIRPYAVCISWTYRNSRTPFFCQVLFLRILRVPQLLTKKATVPKTRNLQKIIPDLEIGPEVGTLGPSRLCCNSHECSPTVGHSNCCSFGCDIASVNFNCVLICLFMFTIKLAIKSTSCKFPLMIILIYSPENIKMIASHYGAWTVAPKSMPSQFRPRYRKKNCSVLFDLSLQR